MRPDRTSRLTIFLAKPCGCTKKPSGFGLQAMMKRFCDGTPVLAPSQEHSLNRVRSRIFDRCLNRHADRPVVKRSRSGVPKQAGRWAPTRAFVIFVPFCGNSKVDFGAAGVLHVRPR